MHALGSTDISLPPLSRCSIAGCRIVGRLCVGNSKGLLLPNSTTDQELQHIRNSLPDSVVVQRVEEVLRHLACRLFPRPYSFRAAS
jgi:translation initiation factor 6 (eIF-6)